MLFKVFATIKDVIVEIVLLPFRIIGGIVRGIISLFKKDEAAEHTSSYSSQRTSGRTNTRKSR